MRCAKCSLDVSSVNAASCACFVCEAAATAKARAVDDVDRLRATIAAALEAHAAEAVAAALESGISEHDRLIATLAARDEEIARLRAVVKAQTFALREVDVVAGGCDRCGWVVGCQVAQPAIAATTAALAALGKGA